MYLQLTRKQYFSPSLSFIRHRSFPFSFVKDIFLLGKTIAPRDAHFVFGRI